MVGADVTEGIADFTERRLRCSRGMTVAKEMTHGCAYAPQTRLPTGRHHCPRWDHRETSDR